MIYNNLHVSTVRQISLEIQASPVDVASVHFRVRVGYVNDLQ